MKRYPLAMLLLLVAARVSAQLLPKCFTDNMVLPCNRRLHIAGSAKPGSSVTLEIADRTREVKADDKGHWGITLRPLAPCDSLTLTVTARKGKEEPVVQQLHNVAMGELWLASGQSNMAFMTKEAVTAGEDIAASNNPRIRLLNMKPRCYTDNVVWSESDLDSIAKKHYYLDAQWQPLTSENAADFSAIALHFARMLQDSLECPVGIICNAIGGSGTEAWIDRETMQEEFPQMLDGWTKNELIQDWVRGRALRNMGGDATKRHPYEPCFLYDTGIASISCLPVKGVIWYQGESNAQDVETHTRLFKLLTKSWRKTWSRPSLPFIYAQLSGLNRPTWPEFRNSQRLLEDESTMMVVTHDHGDSLDVHPRNKRPIGQRMALRALRNVYGFDLLTDEGPSMMGNKAYENSDGSVSVFMKNAQGLTTSDGSVPHTFELAGEDGKFFPAEASIENEVIKVSSNKVEHPRQVRYGWQPFTRANLINAALLPCGTFVAKVHAWTDK